MRPQYLRSCPIFYCLARRRLAGTLTTGHGDAKDTILFGSAGGGQRTSSAAALPAAAPPPAADRLAERPTTATPAPAPASALTAALASAPQHETPATVAQAPARRVVGAVLAAPNPVRPAASQLRTETGSAPAAAAVSTAPTTVCGLRTGLEALDGVYHGQCRAAHEALALARRSEASVRDAVARYTAEKYAHADDLEDDSAPSGPPQRPGDADAGANAAFEPAELFDALGPAATHRPPTDSFR